MTSASVVNGMDFMVTPRTDNMQTHKADEQFAGSLRKAVEKGKPKPDNRGKQEAAEKTGKRENVKTAKERMKSSGETKTVSSGRDDKAAENNASEAVSEQDLSKAVSEVTKALQESLDMTKEDLERAMELLGLSSAELLQPANITALLVEVTGVEDSLALVTDAPLYETWQALQETAGKLLEELADKLGVAPEEAAELLQNMTETAQQAAEGMGQLVTDENGDGTVLQNLADTATDESIKQSVTQDIPSAETMVDGDTTEAIPENVSAPEGASEEMDNRSEGKNDQPGGRQGNTAESGNGDSSRISGNEWNPAMGQMEATGRPFQTEQTQRTDFLQEMSRANETEEIARQILDHMKVQVKEGVSELEMQLHPASLGNVHVLLVAKEGNITAQFTAQTEAVKAALESQMVQLREQFEEQGIKVDAVEVAVSNHQFEKQYQGDEQREFQRNDRNKVRTRRINLEELEDEELDLLLTDEEKLQADIMKKNGSTVDFTA